MIKVYARIDGKLAVFLVDTEDVQLARGQVQLELVRPEYRNAVISTVLAVV